MSLHPPITSENPLKTDFWHSQFGGTGSCHQQRVTAVTVCIRVTQLEAFTVPPSMTTMVIMAISLCHGGPCVDVCVHPCMCSL